MFDRLRRWLSASRREPQERETARARLRLEVLEGRTVPSAAGVAQLVSVPGPSGSPAGVIERFNPDGTLDTSFGDGGRAHSPFQGGAIALAVQPDGTIMAVGEDDSSSLLALVRYTPDGHLDVGFGGGGEVPTPIEASAGEAVGLGAGPDGKVVLAVVPAGATAVTVGRFNPDGSPDTTFGPPGRVFLSFAPGGSSSRVAAGFGLVVTQDASGVHILGAVTAQGAPAGAGSVSRDPEHCISWFQPPDPRPAPLVGNGGIILNRGVFWIQPADPRPAPVSPAEPTIPWYQPIPWTKPPDPRPGPVVGVAGAGSHFSPMVTSAPLHPLTSFAQGDLRPFRVDSPGDIPGSGDSPGLVLVRETAPGPSEEDSSFLAPALVLFLAPASTTGLPAYFEPAMSTPTSSPVPTPPPPAPRVAAPSAALPDYLTPPAPEPRPSTSPDEPPSRELLSSNDLRDKALAAVDAVLSRPANDPEQQEEAENASTATREPESLDRRTGFWKTGFACLVLALGSAAWHEQRRRTRPRRDTSN